VSLRAQANQEGDAMARCFQQSHEAYARGDGAAAKQLSNQGHEHQHKMESLNKQASDWIFVGMWINGVSSQVAVDYNVPLHVQKITKCVIKKSNFMIYLVSDCVTGQRSRRNRLAWPLC
jgi:hypothetical protein